MKKITIKINKSFGTYAAGDKVVVETDSVGTPRAKLWRDRLRDAASDNCVEIVAKKPKTNKPTAASPQEDT